MVSLIKSTASLVSITAIAGLPALLAACVALCAPDVVHAAEHVAADLRPAHHHHGESSHHIAADTTHTPPGHDAPHQGDTETTAAHQASSSLHAAATCCLTASAAVDTVVLSPRGDRGGPRAATTATMSSIPCGSRAAPSLVGAGPGSPPAPPRSPLVLRV